MATKVAINGFGRIGRLVFRIAQKTPDMEIAAINDLTDAPTLAHLLKSDSVHGIFDASMDTVDNGHSQLQKNWATFAVGVNQSDYNHEKHFVVSRAAYKTNCLAPVAKVLDEPFEIVNDLMTSFHSYTNDQQALDLPHKALRLARAAGVPMIPSTTGAAKAVALLLPHFDGKLDGITIGIPTPEKPEASNVSFSYKGGSV